MQLLADDHVHQAQREGEVCAGIDREMLVGQIARSVPDRIDHVKLCAITPRFHDEWPEVNIRSQNVCAPGNDQLRVAELFWFGAIPAAQSFRHGGHAGSGADGAVQS